MSDEIRQAAERWENSGGFVASFPEECFEDVYTLAAAYMALHPADGPSDSEMLDWIESQKRGFYIDRLLDGSVSVLTSGACDNAPTLRAAIRQAMNKGA